MASVRAQALSRNKVTAAAAVHEPRSLVMPCTTTKAPIWFRALLILAVPGKRPGDAGSLDYLLDRAQGETLDEFVLGGETGHQDGQ